LSFPTASARHGHAARLADIVRGDIDFLKTTGSPGELTAFDQVDLKGERAIDS
jgi:hypothetical protein